MTVVDSTDPISRIDKKVLTQVSAHIIVTLQSFDITKASCGVSFAITDEEGSLTTDVPPKGKENKPHSEQDHRELAVVSERRHCLLFIQVC